MKELIKEVLDDMTNGQVNLDSEAARITIATLITSALKDRGRWIEFDELTINGQRAKESWVCGICGKNTYDVDWDYIGSGTNHLGCELKIEMNSSNDAEFDDLDHYSGGMKKARELSQKALEEGLKRQLSEDIVIATGSYIDDNKDKKYIYESPDGGETIYKRKFGEKERELIKNKDDLSPRHENKDEIYAVVKHLGYDTKNKTQTVIGKIKQSQWENLNI